jgi:ribosomal protein L11 methyltransferase
MPNGVVILSGLLRRQEAMVLAAYRAQGLALERRLVIEGWSTLIMCSGKRGVDQR